MTKSDFAIVFPGQGSQSVGMLADIAEHYPIVIDTFSEASQALGYDLWELVQQGPKDKLDQTTHTQPALLTASYAMWKIISNKTQPAMLAGHSLGEYTALVCANALNFADAVKLVAARGEYMQAAVQQGEGAMAAIIGLDDALVLEICHEAKSDDQVLAPANYNSIGQVVIAGHTAAVNTAIELAKSKGAKMAVLIPVSVPSHCALMQSAADRLAVTLADITIATPDLPVIGNAEVAVYDSPTAIKQGLIKQLYSPVRWVETVRFMMHAGIRHVIECGPGRVLTGLNKRIDKSLVLVSTDKLASLESL